jgi:16S rRNA (guanine527-N7)-methyltransferase
VRKTGASKRVAPTAAMLFEPYTYRVVHAARRMERALAPAKGCLRPAIDGVRLRSTYPAERSRNPCTLEEPLAMKQTPDAVDVREDREKALAMFDVSRETIARLDRFVGLLLTWQRRTNLISASSMPSLWTRHVADSLQLVELVETLPPHPPLHTGEGREGGVWLDLGSGGGFPGIVIACALADVPGTHVHLIESNMKKASFLREAIRETKVPGTVHAGRIETLGAALGTVADYVTARALAPLPELFEMIAPFLKKGAKALLLKGQDLGIELTNATKHWNIEAETVPSKTSRAGRILIVHALSKRAPTLSSPACGGG